jgi:hypothetical protein
MPKSTDKPKAKRSRNGRKTQAQRELLTLLDWREWVQYDRVVRHLPFFGFLAVLAVVYISNRHTMERQSRELDAIRKELVELQWYYDTANDELARHSRQSKVARRVADQGIEELTTPPIIIDAASAQANAERLAQGKRKRPDEAQRAESFPFSLNAAAR